MRFPIVIELRRSSLFFVSVVLIHVVSATVILYLPWLWLVRASGLLLIFLSAVQCLLRPGRIVRLVLSNKTELKCESEEGVRLVAHVLPDTTVFNQLIVLRLRLGDEHKVTNLVLFPDQMGADQFRSFRIWLRWQVPSHAT